MNLCVSLRGVGMNWSPNSTASYLNALDKIFSGTFFLERVAWGLALTPIVYHIPVVCMCTYRTAPSTKGNSWCHVHLQSVS